VKPVSGMLLFSCILLAAVSFPCRYVHADEQYSVIVLLETGSSDRPEEFLFGYGDYERRKTYRGYSFWFSLPGPLFIGDHGDIYIYTGPGSALKKFDPSGAYIETIRIPDEYRAELNFTGERTGRKGSVCIRSLEDRIVTLSTRNDKISAWHVPGVKNAKAEMNANGTIFVWTDDRNEKLKISPQGVLLGCVDYNLEDKYGNAYDIVGSESRLASNKYFRKRIEVYAGAAADQARTTSDLELIGTISPGEIAPDVRWHAIGFDTDNNIFIKLFSKPEEQYENGNPLVHVLKYSIDGTLLENIQAMIPCARSNAPAGLHINIDRDGMIYLCGIQPRSAWDITRCGDFGGTDYGDVEDLRFKVWKLVR
jgi:hypothetical protein